MSLATGRRAGRMSGMRGLWYGALLVLVGISLGHARAPGGLVCRLPEGVLTLPAPGPEEDWIRRPPSDSGDLLFPDGVMLLSMRQRRPGGAMVTVSLDQNRPITVAEQAAFRALAGDRAEAGSMRLWELPGWCWIVQEFSSPSERILTAQEFAGPYGIAYIFWLAPTDTPEEQDRLAREILTRWAPVWEPFAEASPEE
jgi:hypothetical protein